MVEESWKERFRARVVHWTAPAAGTRRRALAVSNRTGVSQLYLWDLDTSQLTQLTDRPRGTVNGQISADGKALYYLEDSAGDEIGHWVRVSPEGGEPVDLTPSLPPYTSHDLHASGDGRWLTFTAAMPDGQAVYVIDATDNRAEPRLLFRTRFMCGTVGFSADGRLLAIVTNERTGKARNSLYVLDAASGHRIAELWDGPESHIGDAHFSPLAGDHRLTASSDASGDRRPLLWDPMTGERIEVALDGEGDGWPMDWSPDGRRLLLCRVRDGAQQLSVHEVDAGTTRRLDHPRGVYGLFGEVGNWFDTEGNIVVQWQDATHPATVMLLDGDTGHPLRPLLEPSPVPESRPWQPVTFTVDGQQPIQAWLATPNGEGPFPAVIDTHGGPESVAMEAFSPRAQAWVDHGFAFLTINYRGSITFGRQFKEAIWGRPGELEVRDIVAGRQWLIDNGIARPDEVLLTGWSYGGFLTLHALGTAPGLWAGGAAGIAVADWVSEYEDENDVMRAYDRALFGGPPEEMMDAYVRSSPITYVESVDAPVLIIQGRNDTRCPARQVELYEARMRDLGKSIEVIWFDAGHAAGADVELAIEHQAAMIDFARRALEARRVSGRPADAHSGRRG